MPCSPCANVLHDIAGINACDSSRTKRNDPSANTDFTSLSKLIGLCDDEFIDIDFDLVAGGDCADIEELLFGDTSLVFAEDILFEGPDRRKLFAGSDLIEIGLPWTGEGGVILEELVLDEFCDALTVNPREGGTCVLLALFSCKFRIPEVGGGGGGIELIDELLISFLIDINGDADGW